jgi:hypothetical protein
LAPPVGSTTNQTVLTPEQWVEVVVSGDKERYGGAKWGLGELARNA